MLRRRRRPVRWGRWDRLPLPGGPWPHLTSGSLQGAGAPGASALPGVKGAPRPAAGTGVTPGRRGRRLGHSQGRAAPSTEGTEDAEDTGPGQKATDRSTVVFGCCRGITCGPTVSLRAAGSCGKGAGQLHAPEPEEPALGRSGSEQAPRGTVPSGAGAEATPFPQQQGPSYRVEGIPPASPPAGDSKPPGAAERTRDASPPGTRTPRHLFRWADPVHSPAGLFAVSRLSLNGTLRSGVEERRCRDTQGQS